MKPASAPVPDIRPMAPSDLAEARALWSATEGVGLSAADEPAALERYLARNPGLSLVARVNGELAGAVLCGHDGRRGFLHHLAVVPGRRGRGLGATLVERALAGLRREGIDECHVFVYRDNDPGQAFWRRTGWSPRHDLLPMSRLLGDHPDA